MQIPTFKLKLLKNYQLVNIPGTYLVSVAFTVKATSIIADEYPRYIIPLRVITGKGLNEIMSIMDGLEEVPFPMIRKNFLAGALFEKDINTDDLPIKGEKVLATFDLIEEELMCTHIELLPREVLDYVDVDDLCKFRSKIKNLLL